MWTAVCDIVVSLCPRSSFLSLPFPVFFSPCRTFASTLSSQRYRGHTTSPPITAHTHANEHMQVGWEGNGVRTEPQKHPSFRVNAKMHQGSPTRRHAVKGHCLHANIARTSILQSSWSDSPLTVPIFRWKCGQGLGPALPFWTPQPDGCTGPWRPNRPASGRDGFLPARTSPRMGETTSSASAPALLQRWSVEVQKHVRIDRR